MYYLYAIWIAILCGLSPWSADWKEKTLGEKSFQLRAGLTAWCSEFGLFQFCLGHWPLSARDDVFKRAGQAVEQHVLTLLLRADGTCSKSSLQGHFESGSCSRPQSWPCKSHGRACQISCIPHTQTSLVKPWGPDGCSCSGVTFLKPVLSWSLSWRRSLN